MGDRIDGKVIALGVKEDIKNFVESRKLKGINTPKVTSILVGNDGGSLFYLNNQEKVAVSLGLEFERIHLSEEVTEIELIKKIEELNNDNSVNGVILQLPLPKNMDEKKIISSISPEKDIDCLTFVNQGKLYMGEDTFMPCTPKSVLTILKSLNINLEGMEVVVVGRSNIVGKPASALMLKENCTVTICHSRTKELKEVCKRADILIVAIGKAKFIDDSYVKDGAIVIDVGTNSVEGKITGDVDFEKVINKAAFVTPVPGGVGALTTTLLMKNVCEALEKYENEN
ncbi:tetrahydrofolate dehydrogenase/cyclohydrolase catalytic domain-containing protein [uncultured Clostridium sp.]|uniref:bifunctional 5,10-methylenetetrahydrofolate dehydrogenase/5,10-methenyltetrahydrofolate cyclohydrolase n=1 Tax=Clostridium disporicum TaxID=84024 RepID=UPI0025F913EE|nr:tetrahydrofolate dehydrogenase/cyclohydrolase catalytic domain-containing protein [uncultured Clostridium sp.]MDU2289319.1 tetrahydrofolate dehydrogenase/cyclohydrolase catalytic domain-containing protein [Clostridium celatum]MDU4327123.1 tetrahydrofolate dehydrogenase/cyclohydrolase catalytic domain-containing protein [Clostridium celatum]